MATVATHDKPAALAEALKSALPKGLLGRLELAVALGPDVVRVRRLAVPPVPEAELPAIVAMQAAREAAANVDEHIVDFLPPGEADDSTTLLTIAADDSTLKYWREVADELGGKLVAAVPRPLATQMFGAVSDQSAAVVITSAGDAIDLVATLDGRPYLLRSARGEAAVGERELRRTLLSMSELIDDPEAVMIAASDTALSGRSVPIDWAAIGGELGADTDTIAGLRDAAAATGLALGMVRGEKLSLNLADPRRPPVEQTGRRRQILLAATAATVLLAGGWWAYGRLANLDRQITEKQAEMAEARRAVEAFDPYRERVAALDQWRLSEVTWLDEIERLGRKLRPVPLDEKDFPTENDLRVTQFVATAVVGGDEPGGRINLSALARSTSTRELETRLRDAQHPVEPISTAETPATDAYKYKYSVLLRAPAEVETSDEPVEPSEPDESSETTEASETTEPSDPAEDPAEPSTAEEDHLDVDNEKASDVTEVEP